MGYYVEKLNRPYDYRVLIDAYIYSRRTDFIHNDFKKYYASLLEVLQQLFGVRLSHEGVPESEIPGKPALFMLFTSTVHSLLQITSPWSGFLEAGLLIKVLERSGETGRIVDKASEAIAEANKTSKVAHRQILEALFLELFGERLQIFTSAQLLDAGFDDSKEPDSSDYYDDL